MNKPIYYILGILCLTFAFAACEKREPDFFEESANGAYFDYEYAADFDKTLNFSEHIVGNPDMVSVMLKVKLLGYLQDDARTLTVKTKEVEGYELADVTIDNVLFSDREYEKDIEVKVKRPETEDVMYAVCIYLDGSGDIGTGISGKEEINLYVTESYEMPVVWYSHMVDLLGEWTKEKHIFLAEHTGDNHFYASLYNENDGLHNYSAIVSLNASAVTALLANETVEPISIGLPILRKDESPNYQEPYFWKEYERYVGAFRADKFCTLTAMLGGSNTIDVAALYANETGGQKMKDFHKTVVSEMLNKYYEYAQQGYSIAEYDSLYWVEMMDVTYDVRIPFWWEDSNDIGTDSIVKEYFGEYDDAKYRFMMQAMIEEEGSEKFMAASIFPFIYNIETHSYGWDQSPLGENQLSGEERLKECYRIIRSKNNSRPKPLRFEIPEVALDE